MSKVVGSWKGVHTTLLQPRIEKRSIYSPLARLPGLTWANLAFLTADRGATEAGRQLYAEAYRHEPSPRLRIVQATVLPPIFRDECHVQEARVRFSREVEQLVAEKVSMDPTCVTTPSFFFLAYQGYNDRELMAQLASLAPSRWPSATRKPINKRIRLGFLSQYLNDHTIGQLNIGIIEQLDRARFELDILSASRWHDEVAARARRAVDRYVELPPQMGPALRNVMDQQLDVLHYPDIGMSPFTYGLAHSRLAPVQTTTWGHRVTRTTFSRILGNAYILFRRSDRKKIPVLSAKLF